MVAGGGGAATAVTSGGCYTVCGCRRSARRSPKDGARRARQFDRWHDTRRRRMVEKSAGEVFLGRVNSTRADLFGKKNGFSDY